MKEISRKLYDVIRYPIIRFCLDKGISANHVTIFNHFITLTFGCYFFSRGTHLGLLLGLGVCFLNGFLDYLDGDIAKSSKETSKLGVWLDSGFDVIVQNIVIGSIAIGCFKNGLPLMWVVLFFIGNSANNFVSFNYNQTFGFDSDKGSELFRNLMDRKCHFLNRVFKNMIDPTGNFASLFLYTYRYFIVLGAVFNIMPICFQIFTVISNIKWVVMFTLYSLYLVGEKRLFVLRALSMLDEEREEYFRLRYGQEV